MSLRSVDDFLFLDSVAIKLSKHNVIDLICFGLWSKNSTNLSCIYCAHYQSTERIGKNVAKRAYALAVANAKSLTPKNGEATAFWAFASNGSGSLTRFSGTRLRT